MPYFRFCSYLVSWHIEYTSSSQIHYSVGRTYYRFPSFRIENLPIITSSIPACTVKKSNYVQTSSRPIMWRHTLFTLSMIYWSISLEHEVSREDLTCRGVSNKSIVTPLYWITFRHNTGTNCLPLPARIIRHTFWRGPQTSRHHIETSVIIYVCLRTRRSLLVGKTPKLKIIDGWSKDEDLISSISWWTCPQRSVPTSYEVVNEGW